MKKLLFLTFSMVIMIAAGCQTDGVWMVNPEYDNTIIISNSNKVSNGSYDFVQNSVPVVSLKGSSAEIGQAHGELLKDEIQKLFNEVMAPYMAKRGGKDFFLTAAKEYLLPHIPDNYRTEMEAIASASGMSFDDILLINTFVDIATALAGRNNELTPFVGVSVAFVDEISAYGGPILGKNLDIRFENKNLKSFVFVIHPETGKPFIYVSWAGMVGTLTGMNYGGFVASGNPVTGSAGLNPGTPWTILVRELLAKCDQVPQAYQYVISAELTCGNNMMLTDTSDNLWLVECSPVKIAVKRAHPTVTNLHDIPTYTLSCQDIFTAKILRNETLGSMPEHEERTKILRSRLTDSGRAWEAMDMAKFAGKLANPNRTISSVIFAPFEQNLWIWRAEDKNKKGFQKISAGSSYGIIQPALIPQPVK